MNNKRTHYLKLTEDFFKQDKVAILENSKHGFPFSNILLKMYLLSLKNEGELLLSSEVNFNAELLARLTGHKIAIVEQALVRFKELDLVKETEDNSLSMRDFQLFHESSTSEAERKKAYRSKGKMGHFDPNVPEVSQECPNDVPEKSQECPTDGTEKSQECPTDGTEKSQECPNDVMEKTQACPTDGTEKSPDCPTDGTELPQSTEVTDKEVEQVPVSPSPLISTKRGGEIPTFPKPKPLAKPKKQKTEME